MAPPPQKLEWFVWTVLGLALGLVPGALGYARSGPARVTPSSRPLPVPVTGCALTNQLGQPVTATDLRGAPRLTGGVRLRAIRDGETARATWPTCRLWPARVADSATFPNGLVCP